jgi:NADH-quinone oxidoreductase subunit B
MSWLTTKIQNVQDSLLERIQARVHSPWIDVTGCCSLEVLSLNTATYDWSRIGVREMPMVPCEADLLLVAGWINASRRKELEIVFAELAGKKSVIAIGACAISGAPYANGVDSQFGEELIKVSDFLPVDVYVPGCPPRPEALLDAILLLNQKLRPGPDQRTILHEALRDPHKAQ